MTELGVLWFLRFYFSDFISSDFGRIIVLGIAFLLGRASFFFYYFGCIISSSIVSHLIWPVNILLMPLLQTSALSLMDLCL